MKQNEQEIQRFLQIREEIHDEIKKIEPSVALLQETTKRFIAHFDVFQKLSQGAQEQIRSVIKGASQEMAETMARELSEKVDTQLHEILRALDQSVHNARDVLESISRKNNMKVGAISTLLIFFGILLGFESGYFYNERRTYSLSRELLETYQRGEKSQKTEPKIIPKNNPRSGRNRKDQ